MVVRLDTEIRAYRDQGEDGQLLRLKEEKIELEKKLAEMKQPIISSEKPLFTHLCSYKSNLGIVKI